MKTKSLRRTNSRVSLILIFLFVLLSLVPSHSINAQAPYVYYAHSENPWTLVRVESDGSDPSTIYTPPVDVVRAIAIDHVDKMYFYDSETDNQTIFKSNFDGSSRTTFLSVKINALAAGKGYVYYALSDSPWTLMRRDADGSNPLTVYTPPVDVVRQIAIDFANDKLYFYDSQSGSETIYKSDLDGSNTSVWLSAKILSLAVGAGYVYYSLSDNPWRLMRRDIDGSNPVTVYTPPTDYVRAVAVDPTNNKIYFYDSQSGSETIFKADLDGGNRTIFLSTKINALAVHGESATSVSVDNYTGTSGKRFNLTNLVILLLSVLSLGFAYLKLRHNPS